MGKVLKAIAETLAKAMRAMSYPMKIMAHTIKKGVAIVRAIAGKDDSGRGGKVKSYKSIYQECFGKTAEERQEARDNPEWVTNPALKEQAPAQEEIVVEEREIEKLKFEEKEAKTEEEKAKQDEEKAKVEAKKNVQEEATEKKDYRDGVRADKAKTSSLADKLGSMSGASAEPKAEEPKAQAKETEEKERKRKASTVMTARPAGMQS